MRRRLTGIAIWRSSRGTRGDDEGVVPAHILAHVQNSANLSGTIMRAVASISAR
jgi:hypothetical protein